MVVTQHFFITIILGNH